jgi:hypothetical protein
VTADGYRVLIGHAGQSQPAVFGIESNEQSRGGVVLGFGAAEKLLRAMVGSQYIWSMAVPGLGRISAAAKPFALSTRPRGTALYTINDTVHQQT